MKYSQKYRLKSSIVGLALVTLGGCQSHPRAGATPGGTAMCSSCYTEIVKVRKQHPRTGPTTQTIARHACTECNSELTIYSEGGVLRARCPACVPAGVDCDKSLPGSNPTP